MSQLLHGQILHGQIVLGHLSTVKDGSTNLKCPPRYFPWGVGGGGWGKVEIYSISAQHSWNWAYLELGLSLAIFKFASCLKINIKYTLLFNPIVGIDFFCIATPPPTDLFPHIDIPPTLMTSFMHRITVRMFQV